MGRTRMMPNTKLHLWPLCVAAACSTGELGGDGFNTFTSTGDEAGDGDGDGDGDAEGSGDGSSEDDGHATEDEDGDTGAPEPTCEDAIQNQDETDLDCGGANCGPCDAGQGCVESQDCITESCVGNVCIEPGCDDGVANGSETGVDCGGPQCDPCGDNLGCDEASACQSGSCVAGICAPPNCGDSVLNGSETDVDCGGGTCPGCLEGENCGGDPDCLSGYCAGGQCAAADCLTDADCDAFDSACTAGTCALDKTCTATPTNQGGGCDDADLCSSGEVCNNGTCGGGTPLDCSGMSNACNLGVCNPDNGQCISQVANEGNPCDDGNACTVASVCSAGTCSDPNAPGYVFTEDFSDNAAGWSLGPEWQIGAATASACASSCPGNDPADDHTPSADDGIAGVLIGGCNPLSLHADYCLTSPVVNTAALPTVWLTFWRHLHSDYPSYMTSSVQVWNGGVWTTLYSSPGSCVNDLAWTEVGFNVTAYKNANFQVRWCYRVESAGVFASGQWNVDDVTIGPAQCTP